MSNWLSRFLHLNLLKSACITVQSCDYLVIVDFLSSYTISFEERLMLSLYKQQNLPTSLSKR